MKPHSINGWLVRGVSALSYGLMVVVNGLANALPFNGITTGEVSDAYVNLFAPAGLTFAIWAVIYVLLAGLVIASFQINDQERSIQAVLWAFSVSSWANTLWVFFWHQQAIVMTLGLILVVFGSLWFAVLTLHRMTLDPRMTKWLAFPLQVYVAWITVAVIANATTALVSLNVDGWGIDPAWWTMAVMTVGALVAMASAKTLRSTAILAVFMWAYFGILLKHVSVNPGFNYAYPGVIVTASAALAAFVFAWLGLYQQRLTALKNR
jgi:hypothetical protein